MKLDNLMDALGEVEDRYVISAGKRVAKRKRRWGVWATAIAAMLVVVIGVGALSSGPLSGSAGESGIDTLLTNGDSGGSNGCASDAAPPEAPADAPTALEPPETVERPAAPPEDAPFVDTDGLPNDGTFDAANGANPEAESVPLTSAQLLAAPFYPSRVVRTEDTYAQWVQEQEQLALPDGAADLYRSYLTKTLPALLKGESDENNVCAPMNLYLGLSMLAETAGGNSRQQILDLLGQDNLEVIRSQAQEMWNALYMADGTSHLDLASSLWLRSGMTYSPEVLQSLATNYYASAYSGAPGTPVFDAALQEWIRTHTAGLLDEQANELTMDPSTVLALVSTVSYQDTWIWHPDDTTEGIFHAPDGDVSAMLMHTSLPVCPLWQTDNFTAVQLELANSQMLLILPKEGISPEDLVKDPNAIALLSGQTVEQHRTTATVSLTLPRFDVSASRDLREAVQSLHILDVFVPGVANFEPLDVRYPDGTQDSIVVSRVEQAARVSIDESGCQGAGYVYIETKNGGAWPEEQEPVTFTLDRPFLFAVLKEELPVFAGIVNTP